MHFQNTNDFLLKSIVLFFFLIILSLSIPYLMHGSNDLENYLINYEIFDTIYPDYNNLNFKTTIQDFDLKTFYLGDSLFYFCISVIKWVLKIDTNDAFIIFSVLSSFIILFIFSSLPFHKFIFASIFYLINYLYLFNINQLRECIVVIIISNYIFRKNENKLNIFVILTLSFIHKSAFVFFFFNFRVFKFIILILFLLFLLMKISPEEIKWFTDFDQKSNVYGLNTFIYLCLLIYLINNRKLLVNNPIFVNLKLYLFFSFFIFLLLSNRIPTIGIRIAELGIFFGFFLLLIGNLRDVRKLYLYIPYFVLSLYNIYFLTFKYFYNG